MALLTKEEVTKYLQDILGIQYPEVPDFSDKSTSAEVKLSFLEKLIRSFLEQEPFQSICLMSTDIKSRRRPTWEEVKESLLAGRGGLCYWLNSFMYALLAALGLNASMTYCTFNVGLPSPNNHLLVLVNDLTSPGSVHLVDAGVGYYFPHAMSLDFTTDSQVYTDSFLTYRLWKKSDDLIYMMKKFEEKTQPPASEPVTTEQHKDHHQAASGNKKENNNTNLHQNKNGHDIQQLDVKTPVTASMIQRVLCETSDDGTSHYSTWKELYYFNPLITHKKLEPFFDCFDVCFSDVTKLSTHSSPRAMCWPNGRFLALVNTKLIQEDENGKLVKSSIVDLVFKLGDQSSSSSSSGSKSSEKHGDKTKGCTKESIQERDNVNGNDKLGTKESILEKGNVNSHDELDTMKSIQEKDNVNGHKECRTKELIQERDKVNDHGELGCCKQGKTCKSVDKSGIEGENDTASSHVESQDKLLQELAPIVEAYGRYFPRIPRRMVEATLKNWLQTGTLYPVPPHLA